MHTAIIIVFILGYLLIVAEHFTKINKAAPALLTGVLCWTIYILSENDIHLVSENLMEHLSEISGILFFLMGAMAIVELIDAHDGFQIITDLIKTNKTRKLLWIISFIAFFLSAVLDNLTATIVVVSLLKKLISNTQRRLFFVGIVVIAANAGGAWSPIGDVTTTMLWIGGQVTSANIIAKLILPSIVCLLVPLTIISFKIKGNFIKPDLAKEDLKLASKFDRNVIFFSGVGVLLFVPIFKSATHLPPFMGMLFGLGLLWIISELLHKDKDEADKNVYSVVYALRKIDVPSILFFLGILVSVGALQSTGQLTDLASLMSEKIGNMNIIVLSIGLLSAIIDNVPLVAASMGMYDLSVYPTNHYFWEFLAYCAGTGGSALIIGSAAGVAAMGIEKIEFFGYLKKISWLALLGYIVGALTYILQSNI
ncbi:MAG: sodium:proton antiporter NhaD [Bacteroidetes bacterium]|nr:sodium:proton antiporter NhaD [Bacteroidota bacterium]